MNRLLAQLRAGAVKQVVREAVNLVDVVNTVVQEKSNAKPLPHKKLPQENIIVMADAARLISVIGHLVQNAQDATDDNGQIVITLKHVATNAVLTIEDSGEGMSEEFLKHRLFEPFHTTKGLTGMGIGAHESRAYIEEIGGTLEVASQKGIGSIFTIALPVTGNTQANSEIVV